jgi:hypothetical protein
MADTNPINPLLPVFRHAAAIALLVNPAFWRCVPAEALWLYVLGSVALYATKVALDHKVVRAR